jgi:hypothetical protein
MSFGLNGLIGKGIIVNSLQFEIEMKQSQHDLFWRESWLWCVRRVFSSPAGLKSVFRNALQNATQLFFASLVLVGMSRWYKSDLGPQMHFQGKRPWPQSTRGVVLHGLYVYIL